MVYSNFFNKLWYTPKSEVDSPKPSMFLLIPPTYALYTLIGRNKDIGSLVLENVDTLLVEHCIISSTNVEGLESFLDLPEEVRRELIEVIIKEFYPTQEFFDNLNISLDLTLDEKYSGDSWDCKTCQAKKLDRQRNCPYLDKEEFHDESFTLTVGDTIYSECPIPKRDNQLVATALEAYSILDSGFLPTTGGYGEQPLLFCILSQRVKDKLKYYEMQKLSKMKN